ncbi:hypothetical protein CR513_16927, partial [Mucuna pruriens]
MVHIVSAAGPGSNVRVEVWTHTLVTKIPRSCNECSSRSSSQHLGQRPSERRSMESINIRERLHEDWVRFNKLCATCLHHQISEQLLLQYFYEGLLLMN